MEIIINNSNEVPLYEQIVSQIKGLILSGELKSGDALPSLRLLAKDLKISIITTKRAYEVLEEQGFIASVAGKGSYVANKSTQLLKEEQLKQIEEQLTKVVDLAIRSKISYDEIITMLDIVYHSINE